ncbi:hypothetical protein PQR12_10340 [Paraburkholderia nemoris]|uniref:hypothetical protein n=1 Tax=Paraburkholderia nemoris TaxID=2793076 RepID=UPI0038B9FFF4
MYEEFYVLVEEIEATLSLKVVTFESANPDFFIAHYSTAEPPQGTLIQVFLKSSVIALANKKTGEYRDVPTFRPLGCMGRIRFIGLQHDNGFIMDCSAAGSPRFGHIDSLHPQSLNREKTSRAKADGPGARARRIRPHWKSNRQARPEFAGCEAYDFKRIH